MHYCLKKKNVNAANRSDVTPEDGKRRDPGNEVDFYC